MLIPLGSTEQHGPHLPLDTDTVIACHLARSTARRMARSSPSLVVVAPALAYGSSGEHQGFAGTLSIGQEALELVVIELVRSATQTFDRIVLVNGHGGNLEPVTRAVRCLRGEGRDVRVWGPMIPGGDAHAGRVETSLMLAIAPATVRLERLEAGNPTPIEELLPALRAGGVRAVADNGVLGDPRGASAAEGETMLSALVASLARFVAGTGA